MGEEIKYTRSFGAEEENKKLRESGWIYVIHREKKEGRRTDGRKEVKGFPGQMKTDESLHKDRTTSSSSFFGGE
jgi:hypothetical protein